MSMFPALSREFGAGGLVLPSHHVLEEADRCPLTLLALYRQQHTGRCDFSWIRDVQGSCRGSALLQSNECDWLAHGTPPTLPLAFCFHVLSCRVCLGAAPLLTEESPYSKKSPAAAFGPGCCSVFGHSEPRDASAAAAISETATLPEAPIQTSARRWPGFEPRAALPAAPCPESPRGNVAVVRLGSDPIDRSWNRNSSVAPRVPRPAQGRGAKCNYPAIVVLDTCDAHINLQ
jgi:hypothetical protein